MLALIGSELIDPETCPLLCLKFVIGAYPNRTYGFSISTGLCKVMEMVTVGNLYMKLVWRRRSVGGRLEDESWWKRGGGDM